MDPPSQSRRDGEAADALSSLSQTGSRQASNHEALPSFSPTVVHKALPSAPTVDISVKRETSNESSVGGIPPLSSLFPNNERDGKGSLESNAPGGIPLFMPAQVDRKVDQKPAKKSSKTSASQNSSSPAPSRDMDEESERAAIALAASEHGLRGMRKSSDATATLTPQAMIPKKRAAPKSAASQKKGTAKKSSAKRRKLELDTPTPSDTRSTTPASRTSRLDIKGRLSITPGPDDSSAAADDSEVDEEDEEDGDSVDGDELFCICRKPDDHKYMIACDAGCDDWFHGKCVKISEDDGKLIDRYICPNCEAKGRGATTWKPMCRRSSCRKPARLTSGEVSKYCSQDCGLRFFSELISKYPEDVKAKTRKSKPNSKSAIQALPDPRAGPLDPFQLKALVDSAVDSKMFRSLGNGILQPVSPGLSKSFTSLAFPTDDELSPPTTLLLTEQAELDRITAAKNKLRDARSMLEDRKLYFGFAKDRLAAYLEKANIKPKDICGFDSRLAWSMERFQRWRNSAAGVAVFDRGALEPHVATAPVLTNGVATVNGVGAIEDVKMNGAHEFDIDHVSEKDEAAVVVLCSRKRCERHKMWQRLQVEEARFEEARLADEMRLLDKSEREVRERAAMQSRRQTSGLLRRQGSVAIAGSPATGNGTTQPAASITA